AGRLLDGTPAISADTAARWGRYEDAIMAAMQGKQPSPPLQQQMGQLEKYRVQAHYLSQACFITEKEFFLGLRRIAIAPVFVHGTHDWVCPPRNVLRLIGVLPQSDVRWVTKDTHSASDRLIRDAVRQAVEDQERSWRQSLRT